MTLEERLGQLADDGPAQVAFTPAAWFAEKYPALAARYGEAVQEVCPPPPKTADAPHPKPYAKALNEDFLAATLGMEGTPNAPTVYVAEEKQFLTYNPSVGVFQPRDADAIAAGLSALLLECGRAAPEEFDAASLRFRFRQCASLRPVTERARGLLAVPFDFFQKELTEFIPCDNGMLRVSDRELLPFHSSYRRRSKLAVPYHRGATCPLFLDVLLRPALDSDEVDLLQRWAGLALTGVNLAQKMVVMPGTAGGGKGTFIRVMRGIIGGENIGTLRPNLLGDHFEVGRLLGKTLLYGADVPADFLNCKGASNLKAMVGGDPMTFEKKGSNATPEFICRFNAIVTSNVRQTIRLEGDAPAWARRLAIIPFQKTAPSKVIADLSERILAEEGSGVLDWMLDGLDKMRADGWQLHLTAAQKRLVDDLLMESDAEGHFVRDELVKDPSQRLTVDECYDHFVAYCGERDWAPPAKLGFHRSIQDTVARTFGLTVRNDLRDAAGKAKRGWTGLGIKDPSQRDI